MSVNTERKGVLSASTMAALILAVVTVSVGFGVVLPLLPYLIERLPDAGVDAAQVSRHTGLLAAVYALSPFCLRPCGATLRSARPAWRAARGARRLRRRPAADGLRYSAAALPGAVPADCRSRCAGFLLSLGLPHLLVLAGGLQRVAASPRQVISVAQ